MIARDALALYLQNYLACDAFQDYAPNGLQIEGSATINTLCTAVTASQDVIARAAMVQADAILVHHGFFWRGEEAVITGMKKRRIGLLINHNMNLFAYHLPLDCHLELGNNACLARLLEVQEVKTHRVGKVDNLLWSGLLTTPLYAQELTHYLADKLKRVPQYIAGKEEMPISRIAWCTGAAQDYLEEAYRLGADAYLSGEVSERTYYQAKEWGIHYFACGHHASERYGIQALGCHLASRFTLQHQFIDSDNPV